MSATTTESSLQALGITAAQLPRHIAIIMDGNGRWAQSKGLPRIEGHRRGVKSVRCCVEECSRLGIEQLTLYCLSHENWKRPPHELRFLMQLLEQYLIEERSTIQRNNLRFSVIGRRQGLPDSVLNELEKTRSLTSENTGMRLCLAINYGARQEILDACRQLAQAAQSGELNPEDLDEESISQALYTGGMPDPDLMIRTAGEMRISNFLLWQMSYAEIWVTPTGWPEFREDHLHQAIRDFANRDRRFGGLHA
ncbi:Undecaprenyl diphosphate synthase [Planctomycetales bacterium 10988]|nr:Undecaprenyl diphosphate synthase [Planctomycetales bacterium 10988]